MIAQQCCEQADPLLTGGIRQIILSRDKRVAQVVMGRHYSLRGRGSWSVTFPFSFTSTSLSVMRRFVTHCGRFALVLACVLMQNIQGFGIWSRLASYRRTGTSFIAFFARGDFSAVRWEWVTCWQVGPWKRTWLLYHWIELSRYLVVKDKEGYNQAPPKHYAFYFVSTFYVNPLASYLGSSASLQTASLCNLGDPGHIPGCRGIRACMAYMM